MTDDHLLDGFLSQLQNLKFVVNESAARVIAESPDALFYENQNVFIKSYLVSACSVLEAFMQDLAHACAAVLQERVNSLNVPYNFINWLADHDKAKLKFASFQGNKTLKDISELTSPNYYKTLLVFQRIGIDIATEEVKSYKDYISSVVDKRNKIVHHNDSASDLSFSDIVAAIDEFTAYAKTLYSVVRANPHLALLS